jgi:hypothetical protein
MLTRLIYFVVLVTYVNTIFYQEGHSHGRSEQVIDGAPLVEIILEDFLDLPPRGQGGQLADFHYDDYRLSSTKWFPEGQMKKTDRFRWAQDIPALTPQTLRNSSAKIRHLIGYYVFLFRLNPF